MYTYSGSWNENGNNVGFAFNQDFYEYPADYTVGQLSSVAASQSKNQISVQNDSGFTAEVQKDSQIVLLWGGNTTASQMATPFPDLIDLTGTQLPLYTVSESMAASPT